MKMSEFLPLKVYPFTIMFHDVSKYSRTSMAQTPLEPCNYVRDRGSSS